MKLSIKSVLLSATSVMLVTAAPVFAQEAAKQAPAEETAQDDADIVVTAQKRSERLQDVPLAVTAVSAETLATRNITDTTNLTRVSPTLTYTQSTNQQNSSFRIRGIGTAVFGVGSESSVSVVTDGVVLARSSQGFSDLADIERIEVLRGPQGTLYGKNTTAGAINIVTARPSKELSGKFSATVAEQGLYQMNGTVSSPLSDNIGVRVTGFFNHDDGIIFNRTLNKHTNGSESWGIRGKLEAQLGDLNLLASASYSKTNSNCCQQAPISTENADLVKLYFPVVPAPYNMENRANLEADTRIKNQIYSLEANYDLGNATITSITALQKFNFFNNQDVDGLNTSVPIFTGTSPTAYAQFDINGGTTTIKDFSQELRLASKGGDRFNYVIGTYYDVVDLTRAFQRRTVSCPTTNPLNVGLALGAVCPAPVGTSGSHQATYHSEQIAAFSQIDYRLVGGLKAIAGLRVQHQAIRAEGSQNAAPYVAGDIPAFTAAAGNLTSGTDLIHRAEGKSVHAIGTPLITNSDGKKFGKSEGNAVWLDAEFTSPYAFYQFWLNVDDADVIDRLKVFTFMTRAEIEALELETAEAPFKRAAQKRLAYEVTSLVHGPAAAQGAIDASAALFGQGELSSLDEATLKAALSELPGAQASLETTVAQLLVDTGLVASLSAGRRAIAEGGVSVNNLKVEDELATWGSIASPTLHGKYAVLRRGKKTLAALTLA